MKAKGDFAKVHHMEYQILRSTQYFVILSTPRMHHHYFLTFLAKSFFHQLGTDELTHLRYVWHPSAVEILVCNNTSKPF